jgi:hypothetical protein
MEAKQLDWRNSRVPDNGGIGVEGEIKVRAIDLLQHQDAVDDVLFRAEEQAVRTGVEYRR